MIPRINNVWSSPKTDLTFIEVLGYYEGKQAFVIGVHLSSGFLSLISPKVI